MGVSHTQLRCVNIVNFVLFAKTSSTILDNQTNNFTWNISDAHVYIRTTINILFWM